jgi:hypothetical protein
MFKSKLRNTLLAATMAAGGLIMGTAPVYATPGIVFTGTDSVEFVVGSEIPLAGPGSFQSVTATELRWREGAEPDSFLRILPPSNTPVNIVSDSGVWVNIAQFEHENNIIPGGAFNFTIDLSDTFTLPGTTFAATGTDTLGPTILNVSFTETANLASNAACVAASPTGVNPLGSLCDDIFAIPNLDNVIGSFLFNDGIEDYLLSFRVLAEAAAGSDFDDEGNIIYTAEEFVSHLFIQAQIEQVPDPGSLALLGIGLVGLPLVLARRTAKKADAKKA